LHVPFWQNEAKNINDFRADSRYALESAVNAALDRLLADGVIHRIYASYGIDQRLPAKP